MNLNKADNVFDDGEVHVASIYELTFDLGLEWHRVLSYKSSLMSQRILALMRFSVASQALRNSSSHDERHEGLS